ncbi:MAG TPA: O-antigen ligase family protein [Desulfomonilaceae bacterium]|nr:O-antigen ligase family protein [Desulfomonilaceae bacterium]
MIFTRGLLHVYFALCMILFLGKAEWTTFGKAPHSLFELPEPALGYIAFVCPLALFLLSKTQFPEFLRYLKRSAPIIACLTAMAAFYVLWGLHPLANVQGFGKYIFSSVLNLVVFLSGIGLMSLRFFRSRYRTYVSIALAALIVSIFLDMEYPGFFSKQDYRAAGFAVDANSAALHLSLLCSFIFRFDRIRVSDVCFLALAGICQFMTLSRGGQTVFVLFALCYVLLVSKNMLRSGKVASLVAALCFLALAVSVVGMAVFHIKSASDLYKNPASQARFDQLLGNKTMVTRDDNRMVAFRSGMEVFWESPIVGRGTGYNRITETHVEYLRHAVEGGILGLSLFLVSLLACGWFFCKSKNVNGVVYILVFSISCFFLHTWADDRGFLMTLGMLCGLSAREYMRVPSRGSGFRMRLAANPWTDSRGSLNTSSSPVARA